MTRKFFFLAGVFCLTFGIYSCNIFTGDEGGGGGGDGLESVFHIPKVCAASQENTVSGLTKILLNVERGWATGSNSVRPLMFQIIPMPTNLQWLLEKAVWFMSHGRNMTWMLASSTSMSSALTRIPESGFWLAGP